MFDRVQLKHALLRAAIVLVPSYAVAYITDKMVYVVPTVVATGFLAATVSFSDKDSARNVDDAADAETVESPTDHHETPGSVDAS